MVIAVKNKQLKHVLVDDTLHQKLKILSAELNIPMKNLIHSAILLLLESYKPAAKRVREGHSGTGSGAGSNGRSNNNPYSKNYNKEIAI